MQGILSGRWDMGWPSDAVFFVRSQQRAAIPGRNRLKTIPPVTLQWLVPGHALAEQKTLHAIDEPDSLVGQCLALTHQAAPVFFLRRWDPKHGANPRLTMLVGQQCAHQCLAVDLVGLRPATTARCRDRCRIDHVAFKPIAFEDPVDPEVTATIVPQTTPR